MDKMSELAQRMIANLPDLSDLVSKPLSAEIEEDANMESDDDIDDDDDFDDDDDWDGDDDDEDDDAE